MVQGRGRVMDFEIPKDMEDGKERIAVADGDMCKGMDALGRCGRVKGWGPGGGEDIMDVNRVVPVKVRRGGACGARPDCADLRNEGVGGGNPVRVGWGEGGRQEGHGSSEEVG
jgi:hypothetical protein